MMEFSYEGIGQVVATFAAEEGVEPGMAVAVIENGTVGVPSGGAELAGKVLAVNGDCCAVQVGGFMELAFTGESPTVGWNTIACDGEGGIWVGQGSQSRLIVHVDEDKQTIVIKL